MSAGQVKASQTVERVPLSSDFLFYTESCGYSTDCTYVYSLGFQRKASSILALCSLSSGNPEQEPQGCLGSLQRLSVSFNKLHLCFILAHSDIFSYVEVKVLKRPK